jgi:cytochrome c oxidase subunit II
VLRSRLQGAGVPCDSVSAAMRKTPVGPGRRAPIRGRVIAARAGLLGLVLVLASGCSTEHIPAFGMPEPITREAHPVIALWKGAWVAAWVVGILVWGLIGWCIVAYRKRGDTLPPQVHYNLPIEILYTIVPVVMVAVFFFFTVQTQDKVLAQPAGGEAQHQIGVVGQKWSWSFNYLGEQAVGGKNVYTAGTPAEMPTLVLPVDESVTVHLESPDVIHSFWVPAFLMKMDVIPGRHNSFSFTPTQEGRYAGKCAELCGTYHSRMLFNLKVVSAAQYDEYLRGLQSQGNVGVLKGAADARTQAGLDDTSHQGDQ